jgi:hypothetical protein
VRFSLPSSAPSSGPSVWPLVAIALAAVVLAAPLWCVATPAMPDYPAHLASFWLIGGGASSHYTVAWDFLPNLASEAIVPLAARIMPLEVAARLFLTVTVALWVVGPALIQRALFGRIGFGALFAAFFAYNANFLWGFFNYTFATGLAFVLFAAWIATDERRTVAQQIGFAGAFTLLYFAHLFAFAVLLLAIGCFELSRRPGLATRLANIAALCAPAVLAFLFLKPPGANSANLSFDLLDTAQDRVEAAIQYGFDKPATALTVLLLIAVIAALATRWATVHPRLRFVLVAVAVLTVFAPQWALGGWGVHLRLPAVLGALTFAGLEWKIPERAQWGAAVAALAVIVAGAVAVTRDWQAFDARYAEFRAHTADITRGARLLTVLDGDSLGWSTDPPYWHMAELAVIDRDAFTPLMFTTAGQHVIHARPPLDKIAAATAQQGSPPDVDELDDLAAARMDRDEDYRDVYPYLARFPCRFDQAVVVRGAGPRSRVPAMLRLRHDGSFYAVYDIVRDPSCR